MSETQCRSIRLKAGSIERVREWALTLNQRKDEALETLRNEGVAIESVFLDRRPDGDYLIYYMKADDFKKVKEVHANSKLPIDVYHKQFKQETIEEQKVLELLVDLERDGVG